MPAAQNSHQSSLRQLKRPAGGLQRNFGSPEFNGGLLGLPGSGFPGVVAYSSDAGRAGKFEIWSSLLKRL